MAERRRDDGKVAVPQIVFGASAANKWRDTLICQEVRQYLWSMVWRYRRAWSGHSIGNVVCRSWYSVYCLDRATKHPREVQARRIYFCDEG